MKHVSILVPKGEVILSSVVGAFKVFNNVNQFLKQSGQTTSDYYNIDLVGLDRETSVYNGAFSIFPTKTIEEVDDTDLIIISTIFGNMDIALDLNSDFIPWIKQRRVENGAEVASLCGGAFLLAETGLLNGKPCSTHWILADEFRIRFPEVKLTGEKVITEDDGIYSSGGAYSFLNLLLHLVEKYSGREAAIWCSKIFEIEIDRNNQSQFTIFNAQKDHNDQPILNAQLYIEKNVEYKLSVESLADQFAISRRNFVRRFKKATSNTPIEYIQRVKIEAAKKSLESSTFHINEVMNQVGYADNKAFRNVFKKYTGLSPAEYRKKYNRERALV